MMKLMHWKKSIILAVIFLAAVFVGISFASYTSSVRVINPLATETTFGICTGGPLYTAPSLQQAQDQLFCQGVSMNEEGFPFVSKRYYSSWDPKPYSEQQFPDTDNKVVVENFMIGFSITILVFVAANSLRVKYAHIRN